MEQRCQNCGGDAHKRRDQCPAKGKTCHKCKKSNYFAWVCRSTRVDRIVEEEDEYSSESDHPTNLFIGTISSKIQKSTPVPDEVFVNMNLVGIKKSMKFKLDTWAQVNVIPWKLVQATKNFSKLQSVDNHLYGYSGKHFDMKGKCKLECRYKENHRELDFYVVETDAPPVLSLKSCLDMKLIKLILAMEEVTRSDGGMTKTQLLEDYKDVFTGKSFKICRRN